MKNCKLQDFMRLHLKSNVIVLVKDEFCELISYNRFLTSTKYKAYLKNKNRQVYFEHLDIFSGSNKNVTININGIYRQFMDILSVFIHQNGFLIHQQINIKDKFGKHYEFEDLTEEVKLKISSFTEVQKSSLNDFISMLSESINQTTPGQYNLEVSPTQIVEIGNILFEGGFVFSKNGPVVKKDFIIWFAAQNGIKIENPNKILNKIMYRDNPMLFLDKLRDCYTDSTRSKIKGAIIINKISTIQLSTEIH